MRFKKTGKELWRSKDLKDGAEYSSLVVAEVKGKRQYIQLFMNTLAGMKLPRLITSRRSRKGIGPCAGSGGLRPKSERR
jgi:hypothetical protein